MIFWRLVNLAFAFAAITCAAGTMAGLILFFPLAFGGWVFTLIPVAADINAASGRR